MTNNCSTDPERAAALFDAVALLAAAADRIMDASTAAPADRQADALQTTSGLVLLASEVAPQLANALSHGAQPDDAARRGH